MTGLMLAKAYQSGELCGWAEKRHPGLALEQFKFLSDSGLLSRFQLVSPKAAPPEYFSLHRVARKVLGRDVGGRRQLIGDCVSWGAKHTTEHLTCADILIRGQRFRWREVYAPYYYGTGRVYIGKGRLGNSDGSLGSWMAAAVKEYGTIFEDENGVPTYSAAVAKAFGDPNPGPDLDKWKGIAQKYLVKSAAQIRSWNELTEALSNGYPATIASDQGFEMEAGRDGYHDASGSWPHQMMIYGYGPDYALIQNSWADSHGHLKDFHSDDTLPVGTIRARKRVVERMMESGECFVFSQFDGFPGNDLAKELFKLIGD